MQALMQLQPYGNQAQAGEEDLQQLAELFAAQQLVSGAADEVVLRESQKTLGVFEEAISASKAETQALMLENAALRERLAVMEAQIREGKVLHTEEVKAKDARHAEEVAALEEANKRQQRVLDALDKTVQEHAEFHKISSEHYYPDSDSPVERATYTVFATYHSLSVQQHERAMQGVYNKMPKFSIHNGTVYFTKE